MKNNLLSIMLICVLGIIIYSNSFHCSFHFDDTPSIVDNPFIKNIHDLRHVLGFLPRRAVLYFTLALNYHFNGLNVWGYHLFNLGVHVLAAILVWWLTLLTLSTPALKKDKITDHANLIALFAGLVFVSHPIQTQAVTYIVQRDASLATLFYLASLCLYVKWRLRLIEIASLRPVARNDTKKLYYISSLITAILAMFTKETAITLPLMILLYEFSFFNKEGGKIREYLIPFLLTLFIVPLTMLLTETGPVRLHQLQSEPGISSIHYLLTQFRVMVTYIRLAFLPFHQNLDYDYPVFKSIFELPVLTSLIFLISILYFAKRLYSKYRLVSFSIFWFFLMLLPESSLLPIKDVINEHRLYLPMAGYSMFLVSSLYYVTFYGHSEPEGRRIFRHLKILRFAQDDRAFRMIVMTIIIVTCYSFLTYQRNKVWKDELTLWNDTVQKSPHKARPYNNRGEFYLDEGKFTEAMSDFNQAIALDHGYANAFYNRGLVYAKQGNLDQAIADYNKAIDINPNYAKAYNNRGNAYYKLGHFTQAIDDYNKAIGLLPDSPQAYNNRANAYFKLKNFTQAMSDYDKALGIDPQLTGAYNNREILKKVLGEN